MPPPDWAKRQKADEKSPFHGRKDKEHGKHEHPGGAIEEHPTDLPEPAEELAGAALFPARFHVDHIPPVLNQGTSPQCVAYSNAYDQNQHDRPETGRFVNFDENTFFHRIGGGPGGALMTAALQERIDRGYPTVDGHAGRHQLRTSRRLESTVAAVKGALVNRNHGVLRIGPWFHSWYHPLPDGRLPAPDYLVFWHAIWIAGYRDDRGFRLQQTWGSKWGLRGHCFLPYRYINDDGYMWVTKDE